MTGAHRQNAMPIAAAGTPMTGDSEPPVDAPPQARSVTTVIRSPAAQILIALLIYVVVWVSTIGRDLALHPGVASLAERNQDPDLFVWCLGWWPHAIGHWLNPLFSSQVRAPAGQSLAWVTTIPPLAILAAPLTLTAGPLVAFNLLAALGPPLSAWAAFVLCRRLTGRFWPALVGGAVFGFSAYETRATSFGQLDLSYSVLLPVLAYLVVVFWQRSISARTYVILSAAALTVQFYLFTEIFADLTAILVVALLLGLALAERESRPAVLRLSRLTAIGYLIALVLASPYLGYALSSKAPEPIAFTAGDLASFVLPRPGSLGGITSLTASGAHSPSTAGYIGVPLLILVVLLAMRTWRNRLVRLLTCMVVLICIASLGPVVYVQGRPLVRVPWAGLYNLPIVRDAWMSRLMVFAFLALAVATALWLSRPPSWSAWLRWLLGVLVVANVAMEAFPTLGSQVRAVPAFISTGQYRSRLSPGEIVLVVSKIPNSGLLWQAESGYNFRISGGFFNDGFINGFSLRPDLPQAVVGLETLDPASVTAFEAYIKRDKVGAILLDAINKPRLDRHSPFSRIGLVGHEVGGVIVYPTDGCRACHVPQKRH